MRDSNLRRRPRGLRSDGLSSASRNNAKGVIRNRPRRLSASAVNADWRDRRDPISRRDLAALSPIAAPCWRMTRARTLTGFCNPGEREVDGANCSRELAHSRAKGLGVRHGLAAPDFTATMTIQFRESRSFGDFVTGRSE